MTAAEVQALFDSAPCACYGLSESEMVELGSLSAWLVAAGGSPTTATLIENSPCACLGTGLFEMFKLSFLTQIAETITGDAVTTAALLTEASCFQCNSNASLSDMMVLALLARIEGTGVSANTLYGEAACYTCLGISQAEALEMALLRRIAIANDPTADTSTATLMTESSCVVCFTDGGVASSMSLLLRLSLQNKITESSTANTTWDTIITKAADQSVTNSTILVNDSELFVPVSANGFYLVELDLIYTGSVTTVDFKGAFANPTTSPNIAFGFYYFQNAALTATIAGSQTPDFVSWPSGPLIAGTLTINDPLFAYLRFGIRMAGTGGTLQWQFANNVSPGTSTTKAGSTLRIKRLDIREPGTVNVVTWDTIITKTSDQTVTNTITPQNDTELFTSLVANGIYIVEMDLLYSGNNTTGDYLGRFEYLNNFLRCFGFYSAADLSLAPAIVAAVQTSTVRWPSGEIDCGTDASNTLFAAYIRFGIIPQVSGTLNYQFCNQAAALGRDSTTRAGTTMRIKRLL